MPDVTERGLVPIGFDLRQSLTRAANSGWSKERKSRFLIRTDVDMPASVDRGVWPSVLSPEAFVPLDLWRSTEQLLLDRKKKMSSPEVENATLIVIEGFLDQEADTWDAMLSSPWEVNVPGGLRYDFLGFDVANRDLLSGLSNCGMSYKELSDLRSEWWDRINSLHLLFSIADAIRLRTTMDELVPEHAPFYVFRINEVLL